jgi:flagellar protein FliS
MSLAARYKSVQVETASPPRLMAMVFEAALRHMARGRDSLKIGDRQTANAAIERAAEIVLDLDGVLKDDAAPALAETLHDIYRFVAARLGLAAVTYDVRYLEEAERVFRPISEAFGEAAQKVGQTGEVR